MSLPVVAPQPQHAGGAWQWEDPSVQHPKGLDCTVGLDGQQFVEPQLGGYATGIEGLFPSFGTVDSHGVPIMGFECNQY